MGVAGGVLVSELDLDIRSEISRSGSHDSLSLEWTTSVPKRRRGDSEVGISLAVPCFNPQL